MNYFWKFGSVEMEHLSRNFLPEELVHNSNLDVLFYDQEPVQIEIIDKIYSNYYSKKNKILVTSEYSDSVKKFCKENNTYHLYYFFHGFATLFWFQDTLYFQKNNPSFKNKFLSFNRLCVKDRSYRLLFVSEILDRDIFTQGKISLQLIIDNKNIVKQEIFSKNCKLSQNAKLKVAKTLRKIKNNFEIDKKNVKGSASADLGVHEFRLWQESFLHVVSETVFFDQKLHLTEKIFKPIVSQRPFVLLGAYKNLEYLKSYGFRTFSQWIDESYDDEPDNEKRLMMVCDEVEKIANLPEDKIEAMYSDMQEVLEYNYQHFFTDFKRIIVNELVDNFESYMRWYNNGRLNDEVYDIESLNLAEVKRLLAQ